MAFFKSQAWLEDNLFLIFSLKSITLSLWKSSFNPVLRVFTILLYVYALSWFCSLNKIFKFRIRALSSHYFLQFFKPKINFNCNFFLEFFPKPFLSNHFLPFTLDQTLFTLTHFPLEAQNETLNFLITNLIIQPINVKYKSDQSIKFKQEKSRN